jgi:hypothetical protein
VDAGNARDDAAHRRRSLVTAPALSVVLITDHFNTIRRVVRHLSAQTAQTKLEVVIVCPSSRELEADESMFTGFAAVKVREVGSLHPMSAARATGVREATAPVVFLGETHSYPHPEFAAALIAAHEGPWDVVVPGLDNANDDGPKSWAAFLIDYGYWLRHLPAGQAGAAPTWNVAYKREALLELGDKLGSALTGGDELATAFRARGRTIYFEPAAVLDHANVSRTFSLWFDERYLSGLLVGGNRRGRWSVSRRWIYALASPLIPLVMLRRVAPAVRAALANRRLPPLTIPALVLGVVARTFGEVVGYVAGARSSDEERMEEYELHKMKYTAGAAQPAP